MRRIAPLTLSLFVALGVAVAAENWPQWRGANGQGISTETQLPTEWGPGQEHRLEDRAAAWLFLANRLERPYFSDHGD